MGYSRLLFSLVALMIGVASLVAPARGFVPPCKTTTLAFSTKLLMSSMSDIEEPQDGSRSVGVTERILIEAARERDQGLVQEYGRTIKKDGLDGLRALAWATFHVSQAVFSVLAVALVLKMAINTAGYGYYFDDTGIHLDTFSNLHQMRLFETETARFAVSTEQSLLMR